DPLLARQSGGIPEVADSLGLRAGGDLRCLPRSPAMEPFARRLHVGCNGRSSNRERSTTCSRRGEPCLFRRHVHHLAGGFLCRDTFGSFTVDPSQQAKLAQVGRGRYPISSSSWIGACRAVDHWEFHLSCFVAARKFRRSKCANLCRPVYPTTSTWPTDDRRCCGRCSACLRSQGPYVRRG